MTTLSEVSNAFELTAVQLFTHPNSHSNHHSTIGAKFEGKKSKIKYLSMRRMNETAETEDLHNILPLLYSSHETHIIQNRNLNEDNAAKIRKKSAVSNFSIPNSQHDRKMQQNSNKINNTRLFRSKVSRDITQTWKRRIREADPQSLDRLNLTNAEKIADKNEIIESSYQSDYVRSKKPILNRVERHSSQDNNNHFEMTGVIPDDATYVLLINNCSQFASGNKSPANLFEANEGRNEIQNCKNQNFSDDNNSELLQPVNSLVNSNCSNISVKSNNTSSICNSIQTEQQLNETNSNSNKQISLFTDIMNYSINNSNSNSHMLDRVTTLNSSISDSLYLNESLERNQASNLTTEDDCTLDCDDCIPCNATYDEYMQYLYDYIYPSKSEWILIATHCVVFITGLVGNALVCIAVYTNYTMRTVTNVYIVNLAIADFFVILICLPPSVVWDVTETWFLGESMCKLVVYFQSISVTVSVLTLTFISVDRWYAICFPLRYRTKITRAIASVAFIWIVAILSAVPELLALTLKPMNSRLRYETVLFTQCQTNWDIETEKNFYIVRLVTLYMLPLFLMTIAYFKIVRVLWKSETIPGHRESRNHHQYSSCGYARSSQIPVSANTSTMGQLRARRKAAKMLVAVVIMFAVCYAPVHTFNLMRYTDTLPHNELTSILSLLSHWLCYANSAINPIIYNFMSGKFRREFRNALEKCRCARVRVEDRSLNHSAPASRINNASPNSRSNYQLTSVRDITRDLSRQTIQTTFVENCGNGHSDAVMPMLNIDKKEQLT